MQLTKFKAFDFDDFPGGLQFFHDTVSRFLDDRSQVRPWSPAVDILETENELIFKADVPDVNPKDIDIRLENGTLTVKGVRGFEKVDKVKDYHRAERSYGAFARSFSVSDTVDPECVRADYARGVLTITLPKKEPCQAPGRQGERQLTGRSDAVVSDLPPSCVRREVRVSRITNSGALRAGMGSVG